VLLIVFQQLENGSTPATFSSLKSILQQMAPFAKSASENVTMSKIERILTEENLRVLVLTGRLIEEHRVGLPYRK
jgi:hypothetical protein